MPLLNDEQVRELRAGPITRCTKCSAQLWKNYCREHDDFFTDGHYHTCPDYSEHSTHRKY